MTTNNTDSNWGIMIFKDTFEYLIDGDMSNDEFCKLIKCIYNLRENGELPDENELPKSVKMVWKTLKHSILRSARNKRYYNKTKKRDEPTDEEASDNFYCPWTDEENNINELKLDDMGNYLGTLDEIRSHKQPEKKVEDKPIIEIEQHNISEDNREKILNYLKDRTTRNTTFSTFCGTNASIYRLGIPIEDIETVYNEVQSYSA